MNTSGAIDRPSKRLGTLLVEQGQLDQSTLDTILDDIRGLNADLPFVLERRGLITEQAIAETISQVFKLPYIETIDPDDIQFGEPNFTIARMEKSRVVPLISDLKGALPRTKLAMSNPFTLPTLSDLGGHRTFELCVARSTTIRNALKTLAERRNAQSDAELVLQKLLESGLISETQVEWARKQITNERISERSVNQLSNAQNLQGSEKHS